MSRMEAGAFHLGKYYFPYYHFRLSETYEARTEEFFKK